MGKPKGGAVFLSAILLISVYVALTESNVNTVSLLSVAPPEGSIVVPDDYLTIQEAVGNSTAGDTVFVRKGTYYSPSSGHPITIDKPLTLIGEDPQSTIIDGNYDKLYPKNWDWITIRIAAPDVTVSGFTIINSEISISLVNYAEESLPTDCRIVNNNLVNNSQGIDVEHAVNLLISGNNITGNGGEGISASSSSSSNITITANNITENYVGITVTSKNVVVSGNIISDNEFGLNLDWWGPYDVYENNITDNQEYGIQFGRGCNNATIHDNNIERNSIGINLENIRVYGDSTIGSGNTVYRNNLVDNSYQGFIEKEYKHDTYLDISTLVNGTDIVMWDNGTEGNYWSDYAGEDDNDDGIGDTPYRIDENNTDYHPLIDPVTISSTSLPLSELSSETLSTITLVAVAVVTILVVGFFVYRFNRKEMY
jgi:nitrous oxidase accessory protein